MTVIKLRLIWPTSVFGILLYIIQWCLCLYILYIYISNTMYIIYILYMYNIYIMV